MVTWEVLALRYATVELSAEHLGMEHDLHYGHGRLDYYVWLARSQAGIVLIDTGFDPVEGARRGRQLIQSPLDALRSVGVAPEDISDIVITHLHYDHAGNLAAFPNARFHLQDGEMEYATGRCMCHIRMRKPFSVQDVQTAVKLVYEERVEFHNGDFELFPGISVHLVGGHSRGLQVVRIVVDGKPAVIASDALHLSRYLHDKDVFPLFGDYDKVLEGYRRLRTLAGQNGVIVPGHDPLVLSSFLPFSQASNDIVVIR